MNPINEAAVMNATAFRALRNLGRDRRGASAIEFALLAPLMIGLYIGCVEISEGIAADRKVTLTAGAVANLTAQVTTITPADMSNILAASTAIMQPYTGTTSVKVSCLKIDGTGTAKVSWGVASTGVTPRAKDDVVTIPINLAVPNSSLVFSEVSYQYVPVTGFSPGFSHISSTGITLSDQMYMSPRITPPVYDGNACS
jgi:Flp pilus assembly protein TadG